MSAFYLNELIVDSQDNIGGKLLQYLMSIRESANLMIMATSVNEMDWKKSHGALAESFKKKIQQLSGADQSHLSNFTSIIRYRDHSNQCTRGLSITFGRTPEAHVYESSFSTDIDLFVRNLPKATKGLIAYITLPIIRIALMVHSMRSSLDGSEQLSPLVLDDFAMLDFNSHEWRYSVGESSQQYEVKVNTNDPIQNSFYLRISKPSKQLGKKQLQACWIFDNKATGFSFYKTGELKQLKPLANDKPIYICTQKLVNRKQSRDLQTINSGNLKKLSQAIANHEAYWNGILRSLLSAAGISYNRRVFNPDIDVFIHSDFKGRGFELTSDFLGADSTGLLNDNTFTLQYYIEPSVFLDDEEGADSFVERFNQTLNELPQLQHNLAHAVYLEFSQASTAKDADLVIGRYDQEMSWRSSDSFETMDAYGRQKMTDLTNGRVNTKQFINLDDSYSVETLKRAVSECFLKIWFSRNGVKKINLRSVPDNSKSKFLVLSTSRRYQRSKTKPIKDNIFYCCYQVECVEDKLIFSKPDLFAEMGINRIGKASDKLNFVDFYYPYIDQKLVQLEGVVDFIEDSVDEDKILHAIGTRYLNNNVTLFFEHDEESILSVWESQNDDLWLPPELDDFLTERSTFFDFIQQGIEANAYTKSEADGKIIQDKRRSRDPHYEIMLDGNSVLIHRQRFNQDQKIGRHLMRQFTRIYPSDTLLSMDDCNFLISGLLSPEAGVYKDSGVAQTIYEKIPNLFL